MDWILKKRKCYYLILLLMIFNRSAFAFEGLYISGAAGGLLVTDKTNVTTKSVSLSIAGLIGYNFYSQANILLAGEVEAQYLFSFNKSGNINWNISPRLKAHYRLAYFYPYVLLGLNYSSFNHTIDEENNAIKLSANLFGYQYGVGVSYLRDRNSSYFLEFRYLETFSREVKTENKSYQVDVSAKELRFGMTYYF
ncbi:outer membrane protein [Bartonella sp. DGB1]|uniref:outer membrane protein n=1 Tax=Bartonella sp. DGB1 TaxID=3239807 RepID=UPI003525DFC8